MFKLSLVVVQVGQLSSTVYTCGIFLPVFGPQGRQKKNTRSHQSDSVHPNLKLTGMLPKIDSEAVSLSTFKTSLIISATFMTIIKFIQVIVPLNGAALLGPFA
jgi:hypothetical protein